MASGMPRARQQKRHPAAPTCSHAHGEKDMPRLGPGDAYRIGPGLCVLPRSHLLGAWVNKPWLDASSLLWWHHAGGKGLRPRLTSVGGSERTTMESTVIIERPVEEVFAFVVDLTNVPSMDPSVQSVEKISEGPIDAGTTFRMRQKAPPLGKVREASVRYTAVEPNRKIEFEAMVGPIAPTAR